MTMSMEGRIAVVTGGGSGIGRAICLGLVAAGGTVHILGRDASRLAETRSLASRPDRVVPRVVDLASTTAIDEFADDLERRGDPVHLLVNNAGTFRATDLEGLTEDDYDNMMAVNLKAAIWLTRRLLPRILSSGGGSVINIASTLGYQVTPGCSLYSVAKAGLLMFTRSVALEYAARGVRCNAVSPGVVRTPIFESFMSPDQAAAHLARMATAHPLGRVGEPEEIAAAVLYLASDAAAWITGVNLPVDGGISLT
jgi:NAD(P)-dependent dehydrogenase (short-subunit alcohol dehydrogenase family)